MFLFAHLGIGLKLASPWSKGLPKRGILLGTVLPDVVDKTVYYGMVLATGKWGADIGLISGTRTFGHTALFLLSMTLASVASKSRWLAAIALGMATHLLLDNLGDRFVLGPAQFKMVALLWPFQGWSFPVMPFANWKEHVGRITYDPFIFWTEVLGLLILLWEFWKARKRGEILVFIREQRQERGERRCFRWRHRSD